MNISKKNDPRFWKLWRTSGAVPSMYEQVLNQLELAFTQVCLTVHIATKKNRKLIFKPNASIEQPECVDLCQMLYCLEWLTAKESPIMFLVKNKKFEEVMQDEGFVKYILPEAVFIQSVLNLDFKSNAKIPHCKKDLQTIREFFLAQTEEIINEAVVK